MGKLNIGRFKLGIVSWEMIVGNCKLGNDSWELGINGHANYGLRDWRWWCGGRNDDLRTGWLVPLDDGQGGYA